MDFLNEKSNVSFSVNTIYIEVECFHNNVPVLDILNPKNMMVMRSERSRRKIKMISRKATCDCSRMHFGEKKLFRIFIPVFAVRC